MNSKHLFLKQVDDRWVFFVGNPPASTSKLARCGRMACSGCKAVLTWGCHEGMKYLGRANWKKALKETQTTYRLNPFHAPKLIECLVRVSYASLGWIGLNFSTGKNPSCRKSCLRYLCFRPDVAWLSAVSQFAKSQQYSKIMLWQGLPYQFCQFCWILIWTKNLPVQQSTTGSMTRYDKTRIDTRAQVWQILELKAWIIPPSLS